MTACVVVSMLLGCHCYHSEAFRPAEDFKSWRRNVQSTRVIRLLGSPGSGSASMVTVTATPIRPEWGCRQHTRHQRVRIPPLSSSSSPSSEQAANPVLRDRLGLDDRFGRWRFLQRLLEGEVSAMDANELLITVLQNSLAFSRKKNGSEGTVEMTVEQRTRLREFLDRLGGEGGGSAIVEDKDPNFVVEPSRAEALEALLPDMDSDEDAYKGLWDTVMELHGREAVKIDEASRSPKWTSCCLTARLLLHYDFLSHGI